MATVKWLIGWRWQEDQRTPWRIFEKGEVALDCSEEMLADAKPTFFERIEDEKPSEKSPVPDELIVKADPVASPPKDEKAPRKASKRGKRKIVKSKE